MQSENESRTNGLSLQEDNPNLEQDEAAALIEWANHFFLSDDSDNVNHSDHNPYNHAPSPPVTSPPPPPPAPPLPPPQRSHSIHMTIDDKPRLRWTEELHNCFIECVHQLGGPFNATPKNITRRMKVDGLTILHVKSHLQKYRASKLPQPNELAPTPLPFQHDQSIPHETPAAQSTVLGTMMLSSQLPMQNSVQRSLQIQEGSQEKYLNSLKKRAYDFCAPQVTPRASFKHQKFETFNQAPLPNPSCIISAHGHIHSNEYEQQQSLEVVEEIQSQYLIQKSNNISTDLTTAGAHLESSNCEDFSQVPFPTLPCITAEQIEMQSHSQQATTLLPAVEGYNLSFENAEIQTVLPSGSPLHNNQHGLCGEQVSSLRASFKHRNFETFNQAPLPNPPCIITAQSHMHSNEYEQQQSLEVVEEVQSHYLIQNISTDLTTAGAHLESSNCEDFSQVPFPILPCITSEQTEMQSHSQQATAFLPAVEGYNLSSENAEIQTVLPSGSPLHNNQHGLCGITDWFSGSSPSDLWPGVEYCSFNELDPICFSTMPGGF